MSFCEGCGGQLADGAAFCSVCGRQQAAYPYAGQPAAAQPPHQAYGYAPPPPGEYPYGAYPPQPYYVQSRGTNGMAIASLVLGVLWVYWIGSFLALIFGYVARSQIKRSGQDGNGLAIAGIVLGWIGVAVLIVVIVLIASVHSSCVNDYYGC